MDLIQYTDREIAYLRAKERGSLATSLEDWPQVTPIIYVFDVERKVIYFTCRVKTKKFQNIIANPKVGFTVFKERVGKGRGVTLQGIAEEITDQSEFDHANSLLSSLSYYGRRIIVQDTNRMFRITPTHKFSWNI
jgi:nitroimidazol reductase NimA-like FMN-containing flavoprotein (pyridoxamine 5'-phosphate oxidase superfamily)